jgi:hypothetical protein
MRYVVYDPKDPRKGSVLGDPLLKQIILGEGKTITDALKAAPLAVPGSVVWDRNERRVAYTVPEATSAPRQRQGRAALSRRRR